MRAPGLSLVILLTACALVLAKATASWGIGAATVGILIGWLVGRGNLPPVFVPGTAWVARFALLSAITLLGFTLDVRVLASGGFGILGLAIAVIVVAIASASLLGRAFGVSPGLRRLLGAGTGVCGLSAMAAAKRVSGATDEELALGATIITALGSLGLVLMPALIQWQPFLSPLAFGAWAGASLQAVPHAVGAGLAGGGAIGAEWATVVKLTRVAMLGGVIVYFASRRAKAKAMGQPIPLEVRLFVLAVILGNVLPLSAAWLATAEAAARLGLIGALVAIALQTKLKDLRTPGLGPWAVALGSWASVLLVALLIVRAW